MSPAALPRYTLLIPTSNRPTYLRNLLGFLSARGFDYPIRILDSSLEQALSANREAIDRVELDIVHIKPTILQSTSSTSLRRRAAGSDIDYILEHLDDYV